MADAGQGRSDKRLPDLDTVFTINPDGSRNFIQLADVTGRWQRRKHLFWFLLILVYVALPLIRIGGRPAVHIDLPGRAASLFGATFTNQDFYLLFFVFTGLWFVLFVVTALWGRVWCGYACPQTVFLEGVFRRVERWIEGSRDQRLRRRARGGPAHALRMFVKHAAFLLLSMFVAHVFVAYFIPASELIRALFRSPAEHMTAFMWTTVWTLVLYGNYVWFREQTCLILCPYGRLQGALVDSDTVVIGYDEGRGEPRSKRAREGGDCIDCGRCVAVCPTGIDIRNGLQMECIGCANCIDACDAIMERVGRPHGLIRYDSRRGFETGRRRRFLRPRVVTYAALGLIGLGFATFAFGRRTSFTAHVLRPPGLPYELLEGNSRIRNVYTVRVQNKTDEPAVYAIEVVGERPDSLRIIVSQPEISVPALEDRSVPIVAEMPTDRYAGAVPVTVRVRDVATKEASDVTLTVRGPGRGRAPS